MRNVRSGEEAAACKIMRAIGIEVMHKQVYMMATLIQELEPFMADFANGVVLAGGLLQYCSLDDFPRSRFVVSTRQY